MRWFWVNSWDFVLSFDTLLKSEYRKLDSLAYNYVMRAFASMIDIIHLA